MTPPRPIPREVLERVAGEKWQAAMAPDDVTRQDLAAYALALQDAVRVADIYGPLEWSPERHREECRYCHAQCGRVSAETKHDGGCLSVRLRSLLPPEDAS